MEIQRFVDIETLRGTEEEIREWYKYDVVGVHYTSMGYGDTVDYVERLRDEVLKEYPNIKKTDMRIWIIGDHESRRHARFLTLFVPIPIDDFLRLRAENKIGIK